MKLAVAVVGSIQKCMNANVIKYSANTQHGKLYGFILTKENIKRLKKGQPIHINLAEMGGNAGHEIVIHYEETEQRAQEVMQEFIGPDTIVNPRGKH